MSPRKSNKGVHALNAQFMKMSMVHSSPSKITWSLTQAGRTITNAPSVKIQCWFDIMAAGIYFAAIYTFHELGLFTHLVLRKNKQSNCFVGDFAGRAFVRDNLWKRICAKLGRQAMCIWIMWRRIFSDLKIKVICKGMESITAYFLESSFMTMPWMQRVQTNSMGNRRTKTCLLGGKSVKLEIWRGFPQICHLGTERDGNKTSYLRGQWV